MTNRTIPNEPKAANKADVPRGYDKLPEHMPEREPVRANEERKANSKVPQGMGDPSEGDAPGTRH